MDIDSLREIVEYRSDGELVYRIHRGRMSPGDRVGSPTTYGYLAAWIGGKSLLVHRIIFALHHGYLPAQVDHINNNRMDNRIENLRGADNTTNKWNEPLKSSNKSGVKGVSWHKASRSWIAQCRSGSTRYAKLFKTIEQAEAAVREQREILHGTFCNHGEKRKDAP